MNTPGPAFRPVPRRAIWGWILFEWAVTPFFTLITTFVYAPYFAAMVAPDINSMEIYSAGPLRTRCCDRPFHNPPKIQEM